MNVNLTFAVVYERYVYQFLSRIWSFLIQETVNALLVVFPGILFTHLFLNVPSNLHSLKKASDLSRCVKETLRNMKNVFGNFVTCTDGYYSGFKM